MTGTILLTSANGRTGRAVLQILAKTGQKVRVFIRDSSKGETLLELGAAEYFVGDMDDADSVMEAARGVDQILHIGPPMHPRERDMVQNMLAAARHEKVRQLIYYSVMHPLSRAIRHHSLKLDCEELIINSGVPYTIVQPSRYMQHLEPIWNSVVNEGLHAMPFSTEKQFSVVDLLDLAEVCGIIANTDRYLYGTYELAGPEALSQEDMAAILTDILGKPIRAGHVPLAEMLEKARAAGASEDKQQQMAIMNSHYNHHGFRSTSVVLEAILGRPATRFRAYAERIARQNGAIG